MDARDERGHDDSTKFHRQDLRRDGAEKFLDFAAQPRAAFSTSSEAARTVAAELRVRVTPLSRVVSRVFRTFGLG